MFNTQRKKFTGCFLTSRVTRGKMPRFSAKYLFSQKLSEIFKFWTVASWPGLPYFDKRIWNCWNIILYWDNVIQIRVNVYKRPSNKWLLCIFLLILGSEKWVGPWPPLMKIWNGAPVPNWAPCPLNPSVSYFRIACGLLAGYRNMSSSIVNLFLLFNVQ